MLLTKEWGCRIVNLKRLNKKLIVGGSIFIAIVVFVFCLPFFYRVDPNEIELTELEMPPSFSHPFGTDELGRDILSRTIAGGKISLAVGILATSIKMLLAIFFAFLASFSKKLDAIIMRMVDVMLCFPFYVFAFSLIAFFGNSVLHLIIIIAIFTFPPATRLIRTEILAIKNKEFIYICMINGESNLKILLLQILPLLKKTIAVIFTTSVAQAVLMESSLSFLGLGVQEPEVSWGAMLSVTLNIMNLGTKSYMWMPAGICIVALTFSVYWIGEGINELA